MKTLLLAVLLAASSFAQTWQTKFSGDNFEAVAMRWSNRTPFTGIPQPTVAREDGATLFIELTAADPTKSRDAMVVITFVAADGVTYRRAEVGKVYADPTTKKPRVAVLSKMGAIRTIAKVEVALVPWTNEEVK